MSSPRATRNLSDRCEAAEMENVRRLTAHHPMSRVGHGRSLTITDGSAAGQESQQATVYQSSGGGSLDLGRSEPATSTRRGVDWEVPSGPVDEDDVGPPLLPEGLVRGVALPQAEELEQVDVGRPLGSSAEVLPHVPPDPVGVRALPVVADVPDDLVAHGRVRDLVDHRLGYDERSAVVPLHQADERELPGVLLVLDEVLGDPIGDPPLGVDVALQ